MGQIISIKGLTKKFGSNTTLNNIDLQINAGEIFGLLGPNGSGKTTLLKTLLGLISFSSGKVSILGKSPEDTANKNKIGFLPEIPQYYPFLTPEETLDFYGRLFNLSKAQRRKRIEELLALVGLTENKKKRLAVFSKGMLQRIGLAASLVNDPQLLLLDEPTVGLDPLGSLGIRDLLLGLKLKGKTILLCSHLLSEVEYACDRIAILHKGKLIKEGSLNELLDKQDEIQINIKAADLSEKEKILKFLEAEKSAGVEIERPRQSLEELFCKIIKESKDVE